MYNVIQTLNPKPGSLYESSDNQKSQHIVPDFSVEADDGTLTVTLLNNLPELQIAESFQALYDDAQQRKTRSSSQEKEDRYVKDKYESASAFIKMLRQRQETLFAIMKAIAEQAGPGTPSGAISFSLPISAVAGLRVLEDD